MWLNQRGIGISLGDRPGDEEGDGGRQKSQSEDLSHTLPPQLSGELEDKDPGDRSLDPEESASAPAAPSSCGSSSGANSRDVPSAPNTDTSEMNHHHPHPTPPPPTYFFSIHFAQQPHPPAHT